MRDAFEEQLVMRLGTLGETVDEELPPPGDLELQVLRRRRRSRARRRWSGALLAAVIVAVAASVAVVQGSSGHGSIQVESPSTSLATAPNRDSLQAGTVMLSARGHYVLSLDAGGHTNATMVSVRIGEITYARATDDHRQLWYLSTRNGSSGCGDVVRADIDGRTSKIVTRAVTFDVSPDGSRLALYGAGDLARGRCAPVTSSSVGRVVVVDLTTATSSAVAMSDVTSLRWAPDGAYLAVARCGAFQCGFQRIDVPVTLGAPLLTTAGTTAGFARIPAGSAENIVFGPGGLYELARTVSIAAGGNRATTVTERVERYDARTLGSPVPVFAAGDDWSVSQVIPTTTATYVVATPLAPAAASAAPPSAVGAMALYRVVAGRLAFVRNLVSPGNLTPVVPLAAG